jgi:two-component system, chemotaxis family, chemotaxis protein CheY
MRALVVDDSRAMRMILKKSLTSCGFDEIHEAGNGLEALDELADMEWADVVLVDWNMPEMSGIEFVEAVRATALYDEVPIVMVTTETEVTQMIRALDAGANEYIMKPFTAEVLREKLDLIGAMGE